MLSLQVPENYLKLDIPSGISRRLPAQVDCSRLQIHSKSLDRKPGLLVIESIKCLFSLKAAVLFNFLRACVRKNREKGFAILVKTTFV